MKARKSLHAATLCSFIIVSSLQTQAKKPDLSDEVLSAKTVAIRVNFVGRTVTDKKTKHLGPPPYHEASPDELKTYIEYTRSEVEEVFNRKKRFQVVSDAAKADLVCVVILYKPYLYEGKVNGSFSEVVMILKGGTSSQWDAAPIWVEGELGNYSNMQRRHLDQVARFHDHLQDADKKKGR